MTDLLERLHALLSGHDEVRVAIVFGSRARGTARPDSDLDLAVVAPGVDLVALGAELGAALGVELDVIGLGDPPIPLLDQIVQEGIVVHEAHPGAGALWRSHTLATLETDRPWYDRMSNAWLARVAKEGLGRG
ncbi:MAG: nucleotidyltransferase domain-containing protein [Myxococcales bacterium]|nr:nucleotidyltransferase domain-containing protein [Myxococcales bacterium]